MFYRFIIIYLNINRKLEANTTTILKSRELYNLKHLIIY